MIKALRRFAANDRFLALVDQGIVSASNFLTMLFVARHLAVEEFGHFSLAMMGMLFLANLHRAVITQPLNVLGAPEELPALTGRVLALFRAHGVAIPMAALLLAILSWEFFPDINLYIAVLAAVMSYFLQDMVRRYWYTRNSLKLAVMNDVISYGGQIVLLVLAEWMWGLNGTLAFLIMALTSSLAFLVGLRQIDFAADTPVRPASRILVQQWGIAKWLVLTVLAVWGAGQVYPFLIAPQGPVVVATFSASRNMLNVINIIVQSFGNFLPGRSALILSQQGKRAFRRHLTGTLAKTGFVALSFLVAIQWLAEPLLHLMYGGRYDHAAGILRILAFGSFCTILGSALGPYSLAMKDSRSNFLANFGATIFTFTIGLWLIRTEGVMGAAFATSLSLATAMVLQGLFVMVRYRNLEERTNGFA